MDIVVSPYLGHLASEQAGQQRERVKLASRSLQFAVHNVLQSDLNRGKDGDQVWVFPGSTALHCLLT